MKAFNRIDREMAKLRKEYYVVKSNTEMNPEVKRSELDRLMKKCVHLHEKELQSLDLIINKGSTYSV